MVTTKTFYILLDLGICSTQTEFSREWLGASDRYFSFLRAKNRDAHMTALMGMAARLECLADQLSSDVRSTRKANILNALVDEIWDYMRARAITTLPKRRTSRSLSGALLGQRSASATQVAV